MLCKIINIKLSNVNCKCYSFHPLFNTGNKELKVQQEQSKHTSLLFYIRDLWGYLIGITKRKDADRHLFFHRNGRNLLCSLIKLQATCQNCPINELC